MASDETVAVDLHTHGRGPAFWSADDDRDDQGIKVAGVFGLLDQPAPVACFRLVINGLYKSLPHHPWQGPQALASMPDAGEPGAGRDGWALRLVRRWHRA